MGCLRSAVPGGLASCLLMIASYGCAGDGAGLDPNGRPLVGDSGAAAPLTADFASLQENIFTPICSVCHVGGGAPEGLRLDEANSYDLLVGVPSTEVPSLDRVKPGDPDNSYMIQKLEGHAAVGAQMPFGGPYLSTATIAFIRQWITDGAQPAAMSAAAALAATVAPPALLTTAPAEGDVLEVPPPQILLGFAHALNGSPVDADSMRLTQLPPDPSQPSRFIPGRLVAPPDNPAALMLWPRDPLSSGRYQVSIASYAGDTVVATFTVGARQ